MGIAADALVAAFNPQIAAWSHSPFAAEVEAHLIRQIGMRFGYPVGSVDGVFTSGGAEANHTAVLTALTAHDPDFVWKGLRGLPAQPVFYVSGEAHHSLAKAARMCGLGSEAVRRVEVDRDLRMRARDLERSIQEDRATGLAPFAVVATAGTTNAGVVDPLREVGDIAAREGIWFHVDAAWGGGAAFVPELRPLLDGIERADSITFDAHKWLSVPMGAGMYLTRHTDILTRAFAVRTAYMPKDAAGLDIVDPHLHSMQWSRRFIGLKLFLSLLVAGWDGYAEAIRHQTRMGSLLKEKLAAGGWEIVNDTQLPVVCFADKRMNAEQHQAVVNHIFDSGDAWISTTVVAGSRTTLRACITNYKTDEQDLDVLVEALAKARQRVSNKAARI
jgi:glutamate/tyrosine decarboxylase-like PLP-dependent enzyme